ncbi:methylated-DNA--[protein]-cysteine S-methyltransferase [Jeotgalibaca ciconiae]|uniref:Methylated-DNA--protein-cysteine methyltransferase n=1 Tax=Jeotgalibaca ciconiae TaxID=2496265 RepID=A0A3S9HBJ2_9LACT|nr:methylated-DNA--[protein]-cysteine S-methyltransferase [Jeotgalibaca ciconiae]AZP04740.1 methylated-DNA--[protein]-cysteine S-methyltransferase [Jeotgalibaca ciconiae]HJB23592.1 methylated-DNA--[protein]-cysteine S-methyltransferase [Candidatus Jeotgalibaca pullicola]
MYYQIIDTTIGPYFISDSGEGISYVEHVKDLENLSPIIATMEEKSTPLLEKASQQLKEYFEGTRKEFDLPLDTNGTPFQEKVWQALRNIPYGEVRSYKDIAVAIGNPKAVRAVGGANNRNPVSIITPCHRVIGIRGALTGYGGGIDVKEKLLRLEGVKTITS